MPTLKLTQELVARGYSALAGKSRVELCDASLPGLFVEIRATNERVGTYYYRQKVNGKTHSTHLGTTAELTLAEARQAAQTRRAEIHLGINLPAKTTRSTDALTVKAFFEDHYFPYIRPRKRSWKRDVELARRFLAEFGGWRLADLTRQLIQTFHASILASGLSHASADHHAKLIRQALNLAVEWGFLEKNPAAGVRLFNVDNRVENYLSDEQLEKLLTILRTDENRAVCRIALFLLSTGCRLNEALKATWAQIDRATRVWRIPASNSKSKKIRSVPLNDSAVEVLSEVGTEGAFEHVFVNAQTSERYTTIHKVWGRIRRSAGVPFLRIHDLRHMYASFLVNAGCTLYEVQQILGHSDPKVTQRYAHLSSTALQKAANFASIVIRGGALRIANAAVTAAVAPQPQAA